VEEGVLAGLYRFRPAAETEGRPRVQLLGSGPLLSQALKAQEILAERYGVAADVWSATSYKELRREALAAERWNRLHPAEEPRVPYVARVLSAHPGPVVAVSDYMKLVPDQIAPWVPGGLTSLGTDGFGRSETREGLRRFFEVDAEHVALAALSRLARDGAIDRETAARAVGELGLDPEVPDPILR
jgi:pyruvate dehydrogenase E1 component